MLKFLFFPSMERALLQLQKLYISKCEIMEEIVLNDEETMDKVIFHQLRKITLAGLPILRSICRDRKKASTTDCSTSTNAQALFNEKVSFPVLEELQISELDSITTIWDNQLLVGPEAEEESFRQLRRVKIDRCKKLENVMLMGLNRKKHSDQRLISAYSNLTSLGIIGCQSLRNVFSSCIARNLRQLQDLTLSNCEKIEEIIAVETGQGKEEETNDEIILFPQLKNMKLEELPNLKSFWPEFKKAAVENDIPQVQALFNHKVSTSFQQLTSLRIDRCYSLRNVFSQSIARNLQQLQDLSIINCEKIEEIITVEIVQGKEEVTDDEIIVFPQLKEMALKELPNLKSFWSGSENAAVENNILQVQGLFNYKVKFPSLEEFFYLGSKNEFSYNGSKNDLKEIWNTTVPIDYFCKLRRLTLGFCDKLLSVAPSKLLGSFHNLEEIYIDKCPSLEEIFKVEGRSNNAEEGIVVARDKDIEEDLETISKLPSLVKMRIRDCPKLKSVTFNASKEKIAFPILEDLTLSDGSIFEDIWYGHVPTSSFSKVRKLTVEKCNMLVNVSTLLQRFEVVEELTVSDCSEVVFNLEGVEDRERGATVSSRITDPQGLLAFHNLKSLTVESCNRLKYLFSLSMARNLTKIEVLRVKNCDVIEEVIRNEDQGEEDGVMDEIVFPKLQCVMLDNLANLTIFCGANNAFKLPSLLGVVLKNCPKMQTFTFGRTSTELILLMDDNFCHHRVSDLNKYVEQCIEKRKGRDAEETSLANEIEGTSEETSSGDEIKDDEETS